MDRAKQVQAVIEHANTAGVRIDDGNVVDLLADNIPDATLTEIRQWLVMAGYRNVFPLATKLR